MNITQEQARLVAGAIVGIGASLLVGTVLKGRNRYAAQIVALIIASVLHERLDAPLADRISQISG